MDTPLYPLGFLIVGCVFFVLIVAATVARVLSSRRAASRRAALLEKCDDMADYLDAPHPRACRVITVLNVSNPAPPPYTVLPCGPKQRTESDSSTDSQIKQ